MKTISFCFIIILLTSCMKDWKGDLGNNFLIGGGYNFPNLQPDSNNKIKAEVLTNGVYNLFSASGADFARYTWPTGDSSYINLSGQSLNVAIGIHLSNILTPGIYSFGQVGAQRKRVDINYSQLITGAVYRNKHDVLSGSIKIDSLTTNRIKGSFNVTCWYGADSVNISNGSFVGNLR